MSHIPTPVAVGEGGTGASSASTARSNLGLGTIATQAANSVSITGGTITNITDLAVADGGTGASTLTGYVKGAGTLALTASATIPNTDITGLGTMSTQAASNVAITGGSISGITDLAIADGGTGASTASTARTNLGTNDAANLTTGTVATARLATGTANSSTYLRGDQTWQNPVAAAWPVGSVFLSVSSTNPATSLGFGTWASFGAGRMLVGFDASQTEFDTVEETGGSKTTTLAITNLPGHTHGISDPGHSHTISVLDPGHNHTQNAHSHSVTATDAGHTHTQASHNHTITISDPGHVHGIVDDLGGGGNVAATTTGFYDTTSTFNTLAAQTGISASSSNATPAINTGYASISASAGNETATNNSNITGISASSNYVPTGITTQSEGNGTAATTLSPYIVVYMFKRTA